MNNHREYTLGTNWFFAGVTQVSVLCALTPTKQQNTPCEGSFDRALRVVKHTPTELGDALAAGATVAAGVTIAAGDGLAFFLEGAGGGGFIVVSP
jgi:hypothetical protein